MPYVRLETTEVLRPEAKQVLGAQLSRICADTIGKPEKYVQAVVLDGVALLHGGAPGPAAFVDVRSIGGLTPAVCQALAQKVCATLKGALNVPGRRVYLNFTDVPAAQWGHDGSTFG
jgi:phenylpyruvate tautomerase PptA (4-oxalocrotonate tautomerase family)